MKKRIYIISFFICLLLCSGCTDHSQPANSSNTISVPAPNHIKEVTNLSDADISIPSVLVGDEIQDMNATIVNEASNDENQIIVSISGNERTKLVNQLADSIENAISDILNDKEKYEHITEIIPNDDCTEFTIYLNGSDINLYESMLAVSFYTIGNKYQIYDGIAEDNALTTVKYINKVTDEIIVQSDSSSLNLNP